ncbi:hypothetical protein [Haloarchaeobius sp. DT45]|uniref:hypothetical protein n=1 Tax=Haloarchaeobius sp. DT45 TaxID=3446116 RepID=UPI003F6CE89E
MVHAAVFADLAVFELANIGLLVAYASLLAVFLLQYRRGDLSGSRLFFLVGMCLSWLAYSVLQLTGEGRFANDTVLNYVLDGFSAVLLVGGLYALYRGWRARGSDGGENGDGENGRNGGGTGHGLDS